MEINREFRKIPSLKFLYEVSEDGRIFRNVKSKKQSKIIVDHHHSEKGYCYTFICREGKVQRIPIARVVAECWLGEKPEGYEIEHRNRNSLDNHYTNLRYVTKSEQIHIDAIKKPVILIKDGESKNFESQTAAARCIAEECGQTVEHVRAKFKKRRSHIYGYKVIYLNGETARTRSTEQETVQEYLVGTTDRWNDSKQSEEHERVKHNVLA
ncbi:MAG: HNH endonuclease [Selenomonadaceae bacterium]|nr:HNH endonuclease [Selenomonadaceae bacterium]